MKRSCFFLFLVLNIAFHGYAQSTLIVLHSVVGDTISLAEKRDYLLFPEIPDSTFEEGILLQERETYQLVAFHGGDSLMVDISAENLEEYRQHVEKLYAYYTGKQAGKSDSLQSQISLSDSIPDLPEAQGDYLNDEARKKIRKDAFRYQMLNNMADDQGLRGREKEQYMEKGGSGLIWMGNPKKKKKKKKDD